MDILLGAISILLDRIKKMQKTKKQIIEETANHYNSNNRSLLSVLILLEKMNDICKNDR